MPFSLRTLQAALVMFTRLPLASQRLQAQHFQQATNYLPLSGLCVGLLCCATYALITPWLSVNLALLISLISAIIITGAIHEDGFADCCDGFFAMAGLPFSTQTQAKTLSIMKDSRLGSYAVLGLISIFILRWQLLLEIPVEQHINALLCLFTLSKFPPLWIIQQLNYVSSADTNSKMGQDIHLNYVTLLIITVSISALFSWLIAWPLLLILITALAINALLFSFYFKQRLLGYNGDCLGACEHISGSLILLVFAFYF